MLNFELYSLMWPRGSDGYMVLPHPKRVGRRSNKPEKIRTLLDNPENFSEYVLRAVNSKVEYYQVFNDRNLGAAREFAGLVTELGALDKDLALGFANRYGLLGVGYNYEDFDTWLSMALRFKNILALIDSGHAHNKKREEAVRLYNSAIADVLMKPFVNWDNKRSHRHVFFQPINLAGALCIILGSELSGGLDLKQCGASNCMRWFPRKGKKQYCSPSCKAAAFREKSKK